MLGVFVMSTAIERLATKYGMVKSTVCFRSSLIVIAEIPTSNCPFGTDCVKSAAKSVVVDLAVRPSRFATSL
jgi:hypothetical protein